MGILETSNLISSQKVKEGVAGKVGVFLNRILGLKVEKQNLVYIFDSYIDNHFYGSSIGLKV